MSRDTEQATTTAREKQGRLTLKSGGNAVDQLRQELDDGFDRLARNETTAARVEVRLEADLDLLSWIANQTAAPRLYWRDRGNKFEMAGCGSTVTYRPKSIDDLKSTLYRAGEMLAEADDNVRLYGGLRFDLRTDSTSAPEWHSFGRGYFVLPNIEVYRDQHGLRLCCNLTQDNQSAEGRRQIEELLDGIKSSRDLHLSALSPASRHDSPSKDQWDQSVNGALRAFEQNVAEKIVLARRSTFAFADDLDAWALLARLRRTSIDSYLFAIQPDDGAIFVGATPERLYHRNHKRLATEALAGTRPRGRTPTEDRRIGEELLNSVKDVREHEYVARAILTALNVMGERVEAERTLVLRKLARVQHLATTISCDLRDGIDDVALLSALHPTPAVGGFPTAVAQRLITEIEPFDRGWYAGPIGWLGKEAAEFAVAIRSALIHGDQLSLYSGAGIVQGSTAEGEWQEIENKIENFIRVMTT